MVRESNHHRRSIIGAVYLCQWVFLGDNYRLGHRSGGTYAADASVAMDILPIAPEDVQAVRNIDGTVTITWSNPSAIASTFAVSVSANGGNFTALATGVGNTSYTACGLDPTASLVFDVAAANASGGQGTPAQVLLPPDADTSTPASSILSYGLWFGPNPNPGGYYYSYYSISGSDGNLTIADGFDAPVNATFDGTTLHLASNSLGWPNAVVSADYNTITWQEGSSSPVVWTRFNPVVQVVSLTVTDTNTGISGNTTSPGDTPTLDVTTDANGNMDLAISATVSPTYATCPI